MDVRKATDLVELFAGRAGVAGDAIDRKLILELINAKLSELFSQTLHGVTEYEFTTEDSTYEYDLPSGVIPYEVEFGGKVIDKCTYKEAWKWRYGG